MTHRESKKQAKPQDNKSTKVGIIHNEEIQKHKTKGTITGNE